MIDIKNYIPTDGRIKTRELCTLLNMNAREVRQAIANARLQGVPILADKDGLYLSENSEEVESYCRRLSIVINSLKDIKKAIREVIY